MITKSTLILDLVAIVWVGGWGFAFYRRPDFFTRLNARFGFARVAPSANFIRNMGILEMILAALSLLSLVLMSAFHLKS